MKNETNNNSILNLKPKIYLLLFTAVLLGGAFFRLHLAQEQIIGDDEWHGINIAVNMPFKYILTHFHSCDNCIPLTIFYRLLLKTTGLNEWGLHGLQLGIGIIAIWLLPLFIKPFFSPSTRLTFAFFIAFSPFLIYYSRYARPYIIVFFLSFSAVFAFIFWRQSKKRIYLVLYSLCVIFGTYFHILTFPFLITPYLYSWLNKFFPKQFVSFAPSTEIKPLIFSGLFIAISTSAWFLPALPSLSSISEKVGLGTISGKNILVFIHLFSGTKSQLLSFLFLGLSILGLTLLWKQNRYLANLFLFCGLVQLGSLLLVMPYGLDMPVVFARYLISCLPIYLLCVSLGLTHFSEQTHKILIKQKAPFTFFTLFFALILGIWFFLSPLPTIYGFKNNFGNHDDFQYDYSHPVYDPSSYSKFIPAFYLNLREKSKDTTIIETPLSLWWNGNVFHYYQKIHQKKILIGHFNQSFIIPRIVMHPDLKLKNFVNIQKQDFLNQNQADYLILHKQLPLEVAYMQHVIKEKTDKNFNPPDDTLFEKSYGSFSRQYATVVSSAYEKLFGKPVYEDKWITVFKLNEKTNEQ